MMNKLPVYIPVLTFLYVLLMLAVNVPAYQSNDWSWTNVPFSIGIVFTVISIVCMILKSFHFAWLQLLGALMAQLYILPLFFRLFFAVMQGQREQWTPLITVSIIFLLLSIVSWKSFIFIEDTKFG